MSLRVAYLINQYPRPSHSFIRREIVALEALGARVERIALRGWNDSLVDEADARERERTRYILRTGWLPLLWSLLGRVLVTPLRFAKALALASRMTRSSHRPWVFHYAYLAEACTLVAWLRTSEIEHLHAHFGTNAAEIAMLAQVLGGPPYSFTVHGPEEFDQPRQLKLEEKIVRAAFVVAISSFCRSQLYRWVAPHHWHKIHVVRCGVDERFYSVEPRALPDIPRFVCVGRLCEQKGQALLIEAVALLRDTGVIAELVLAGDGDMREELEEAIDRHGLRLQVRITGWIDGDGVRDEILASRALVLASFAEGLPVVLMEAMALERPVLATCVAGIPELVVPGENGWLVPPGDVEHLAQALREVLETPSSHLRQMGEAGRKRVRERHSVHSEAAKLLLHFERGLDGART